MSPPFDLYYLHLNVTSNNKNYWNFFFIFSFKIRFPLFLCTVTDLVSFLYTFSKIKKSQYITSILLTSKLFLK